MKDLLNSSNPVPHESLNGLSAIVDFGYVNGLRSQRVLTLLQNTEEDSKQQKALFDSLKAVEAMKISHERLLMLRDWNKLIRRTLAMLV